MKPENEPKVAILLATYNGSKYIHDQIKSIFNQTYSNWHIYIHDDGSCDNTIKILSKYPTNKVSLLEDGLVFKSAKLNFLHLINSVPTSYDYYMFCDQDDYWVETKIESQITLMNSNNTNVPTLCFHDLFVADKNLKIIHKSMQRIQKLNPSITESLYQISAVNVVTGCTVLINKQLLLLARKYSSNYFIMHDWWLAILARKYGAIHYIDKSLIYYRQHSNNEIGAKNVNLFYYLNSIRKLKNTINSICLSYEQQKSNCVNLSLPMFLAIKAFTIFKRIVFRYKE